MPPPIRSQRSSFDSDADTPRSSDTQRSFGSFEEQKGHKWMNMWKFNKDKRVSCHAALGCSQRASVLLHACGCLNWTSHPAGPTN